MKKGPEYEIAHLAVAVPNLENALAQVQKVLGVEPPHPPEVVEDQKVRLQFLKIGGVRFEFLEPISAESPISKFLEKRGSGVHHLALKVPNLEAKLAELKTKGVSLIDDKPRIGAEGCKIAFVHPKSSGGILIELIEEK